MSQKKKSKPKLFSSPRSVSSQTEMEVVCEDTDHGGNTVEFDSCYRGKIEIWKDENGEVVRVSIIR